jgi:DNA-binding response OmpR family regulator
MPLIQQSLFISSGPIEDALNHSHQLRNVLIIEDEPSMRNVLNVLLAGLGCEGDIAHHGRRALAMIEKESFDAVLLDLRCSEMPAGEMVSAIKELRSNLMGRVLVITGEVSDPQTLEMITKNCWPHIPRQRVMQELWERLRTLLSFSQSPADSTFRCSPPTRPSVDSSSA